MEITFTKVLPDRYEAEFIASADFNLHIEKKESGILLLQQRGCDSGKYDTVGGLKVSPSDLVFDYDFTALVYPKHIKIVSEVEPALAEVIFATSGGSGGGESSGDDVIFFDAAKISDAVGSLTQVFMPFFMNSSFINKTTYYAENFMGRLPFSAAAPATNLIYDSEIAYVGVSNSLTPTVVFMGSGSLEIPEQEEPIGVYEFFEILNSLGMTVPIDVFKEAEVSREVVEQWMQE